MAIYFKVYNPLKKWKKGEHPISPQVSIELSSYKTELNGAITFSPYMATDNEIDQTIDLLIKELEQARMNAKKELKITLKKQLEK